MTKLTNKTFNSLNRIALSVFEPGSSYLNEKEFEANCTRKIMKSATVQLRAMIKTIGNLRLFTIDPLGTISLCKLMDKSGLS